MTFISKPGTVTSVGPRMASECASSKKLSRIRPNLISSSHVCNKLSKAYRYTTRTWKWNSSLRKHPIWSDLLRVSHALSLQASGQTSTLGQDLCFKHRSDAKREYELGPSHFVVDPRGPKIPSRTRGIRPNVHSRSGSLFQALIGFKTRIRTRTEPLRR
jgi:hypothetical protein